MSRRSSRKHKRNLIKLKNSTRVSLVTLALVVFAISFVNFNRSIFKTTSETVEENLYTYTNDFKSDYSINLKNNPYITESTLPSGQTYVSDLINSIDMNLNYQYSASQDSHIKYTYKIDAIIGANYNNNGTNYTVWNKVYNLKTSEELQTENKINIDENINIDYQKYHQEVKAFKQDMGMALEAYLYIKLTVNTLTNINSQEITNEYSSNFSTTLGDKIAVVKDNSKSQEIESVKQENTIKHTDINVIRLLFNLIIIIACLYVIHFVYFKTRKLNTIRNEFKLELNRILKSCQDRIVIVKNQIDDEEENIIDVNDFGELIKLSEELYKPILCWISEDLNNEQAWFSVISNKIKYRYILKK